MRFERALAALSPLHRDIIGALLRGDDERSDEILAVRHGTSPGAVRGERFLARARLRAELRSLGSVEHSEPYLPN